MTDREDHSARAHARLSASNSKRWMNCPGSVSLSESVPRRSSDYADEGTAAHELASAVLRERDADVRSFLHGVLSDNPGAPLEFASWARMDDEELDSVQTFVDVVRGELGDLRALEIPHSYLLEQRLDELEGVDRDLGGTLDCGIAAPGVLLEVIDFKHGAGVLVEVERNPQLMTYALGVLLKLSFAALSHDYPIVELVVVQPRRAHPDGPVRRWRTTVGDLHAFADELRAAAERTRPPAEPAYVPGRWCDEQFCAAKHVCPALHERAQALAAVDFAEPSDLQLAELYAQLPLVRSRVKAVEAVARARAAEGMLPGWKYVEGPPGDRAWADEDGAVEASLRGGHPTAALLELHAPRRLLSPAQMEKLQVAAGRTKEAQASRRAWKDLVGTLVRRPPGPPKLVPESDPRPAILLSSPPELDFGPVEE